MIRVADVTDLFNIDWQSISKDADSIPYPPVITAKIENQPDWYGEWGGWGITTKDGSYKSAFAKGNYIWNEEGLVEAEEKREINGLEDINWTEVVTPSIKDAVEKVKRKGWFPTRVRITRLGPKSQGGWHADGEGDNPLYRLHFVLKTNPLALFEAQDRKYHLSLHRAYIFNTNFPHRISNSGDEERLHLMMNLNMPKQVDRVCKNRYI